MFRIKDQGVTVNRATKQLDGNAGQVGAENGKARQSYYG